MAKILTFAAWKGGVGKTTIVFNLSVLNQTKKILLIDIDFQCNLSNSFLSDYWDNSCINDPQPYKTKFKNIDIIPSHANIINHWEKLNPKEIIEKYSNSYDYIIFDTPPTNNIKIIEVMNLSNEIYLITDASIMCYSGILKMIDQYSEYIKANNLNNNLKGIILNNLNRFKFTNSFINTIKNNPKTNSLLIEPFIYKRASIYKTLMILDSITKMDDKNAQEALVALSNKIIK